MKSLRFSVPAVILAGTIVFFFLFQHGPLQAQGRLPRAVAWEYKIIRTGLGGGDKALQEAGAQGWECVSFAFSGHSGTPNGECFVLKRPKAGP
jgi:hypothetical protein